MCSMRLKYGLFLKGISLFLLAIGIIMWQREKDAQYRLPKEMIANLERRPSFVKHADLASEDVKKIMEERSAVLGDACSRNVGMTIKTRHVQKDFYVRPYDFYVCLVAKVASTFWSRFLYQLYHTNPMGSPFDVSVKKAYGGLADVNSQNYQDLNLLNVSTKTIFVREPYGRLFSAYVDKLLPPNPMFWKAWGQRAVMENRENAPPLEFVSGSDATFSEFVSFAVTTGCKIDVHLIPVFKICTPCNTKFNTIGKMETFERDAKYVSARLGIPEEQIGFDRMKADQEQDALTDSTGGTFSAEWLRSTLRVITLEAAAQRVWRKLQIRGFISWRQRLRLTPDQRENLDTTELVKMLERAKLASTNETELNIQKKQAFMEAYSTLKPIHIQRIMAVYGPDFKLFGYDMELIDKMRRERPEFKNTDSLDWSKDWDLSPIMGT